MYILLCTLQSKRATEKGPSNELAYEGFMANVTLYHHQDCHPPMKVVARSVWNQNRFVCFIVSVSFFLHLQIQWTKAFV